MMKIFQKIYTRKKSSKLWTIYCVSVMNKKLDYGTCAIIPTIPTPSIKEELQDQIVYITSLAYCRIKLYISLAQRTVGSSRIYHQPSVQQHQVGYITSLVYSSTNQDILLGCYQSCPERTFKSLQECIPIFSY